MAIESQHQVDAQQGSVITVRQERRLPVYVKAASALALGSAAVVGLGQIVDLPGIPKIGDYFTTTITPEQTEIQAKRLVIEPTYFACRAIGVYDAANSQALVKAHGFDHAAVASTAKVVVSACITNPEIRQVDAAQTDENTNVIPTTVYVKASSIAFNAEFSEADTRIVDASGGGTELLEGGAQAGDAIIDGLCTIATLGNCDNGLGNPLDAAVQTSREDQAKTEQYLRMKILQSVQEKCVADDWSSYRTEIVESYEDQARAQGASVSDISVVFVDDSGNSLPDSYVPDTTAKTVGSLIKSGAITDTMPDVEIDTTKKPVVTCTYNGNSAQGAQQ
ncbi:MAG: hypothetical protein U0491_02860 [Candidatus Saccharimonadales bacterium]